MKRLTTHVAFILSTAVVALAVVACNPSKLPEKKKVETEKEKFSYAIGMNIGQSLQMAQPEIDMVSLVQGMQDTLAKKKPEELLLKEADAQKALQDMSVKIQERIKKESEEKAKKASAEGENFLAENAKKSGIKTTASGLQYEVLREGTGKQATKASTVTVNYKGTLTDGTVFDSSYERKEPATFPLAGVIPGWTEGMQLVKEGGKIKLYVPAKLGYGEQGAGPKIPPNSVLVFEVELLKVQ